MWPLSDSRNSCGWELDVDWLEAVRTAAQRHCDDTISLETVEAVLLAAEVLAIKGAVQK